MDVQAYRQTQFYEQKPKNVIRIEFGVISSHGIMHNLGHDEQPANDIEPIVQVEEVK